MNALSGTRIDDSRTSFTQQSFSGYKKTELFQSVFKNMVRGDLEAVCQAAVEIHISGWIHNLWEKMVIFSSKQIHLKNPMLPQFMLHHFTQHYQQLLEKNEKGLETRNMVSSRVNLAQALTVLTLSIKGSLPTLKKIPDHEFDLRTQCHQFAATDTKLVSQILRPEDPPELRITLNEFASHLVKRNGPRCLYWLNWMIQWEKLFSKRYKSYPCAPRPFKLVAAQYHREMVWILWTLLLTVSKGQQFHTHIESLCKLYQVQFTGGKKTSRQSLLIHAVMFFTEDINYAIPVLRNKDVYHKAAKNIHRLYQDAQSVRQRERTILPPPMAPHQDFMVPTAPRPPAALTVQEITVNPTHQSQLPHTTDKTSANRQVTTSLPSNNTAVSTPISSIPATVTLPTDLPIVLAGGRNQVPLTKKKKGKATDLCTASQAKLDIVNQIANTMF